MSQHFSVSMGAKAVTSVHEAIVHAHAHPDHDPIVWFRVTDMGQESYWTCPECGP